MSDARATNNTPIMPPAPPDISASQVTDAAAQEDEKNLHGFASTMLTGGNPGTPTLARTALLGV